MEQNTKQDLAGQRSSGVLGSIETVWVWLCLIWLLAGPRISILDISNSSLRFEDVLLASLFVIVIPRWKMLKCLPSFRSGISFVFVASVVAVVIGAATGKIDFLSGSFYAVRPIEYWIIYPALLLALNSGWSLAKGSFFTNTMRAVTALQVGIAGLQYLGLSIGFSKFSYTRGAGLTAGPYELGAICAALGCYWLGNRQFWWVAVAGVGVVLSQSRISLLALAAGATIIYLSRFTAPKAKLVDERKRLSPFQVISVTCVVAVSIASLPYLLKTAQPLGERLASSSLLGAWNASADPARSVGPVSTSADYFSIAYADVRDNVNFDSLGAAGDASNIVRFFRWHLLLNSIDTPPEVAFGEGPSFAGPSVDGSILRIYVEAGLLGLLAWFILLVKTARRSEPWLLAVIATLIVGGAFIDLFFAMRPMVLVWALVAFARFTSIGRMEEAGPVLR